MSNILKKILIAKQEEVFRAKQYRDFNSLRRDVESSDNCRNKLLNFEASISNNAAIKKISVIAEIKKASPSKGIICPNFQPLKIAQSYVAHGATCLSILTDKLFFHGSQNDLQQVRNICTLPILRKDFIIDTYQIYESRFIGADAILLIVAALDFGLLSELEACAHETGMAVLVEIHNKQELDIAMKLNTRLIGINNRDLNTFNTTLKTTLDLAPLIPANKLIITESGITKKQDIKRIINANVYTFLIGEIFMRASKPGIKLTKLFSQLKT